MATSVNASAAFIAGLLNFFASCLLPLVPLYLAHLGQSGASGTGSRERTSRVRWGSIGFVLSFTIVFVLLGVGAHGIFQALTHAERTLEILGGVLLLLLTIPLLPFHTPFHRTGQPKLRTVNQPFLNGIILGLVFSVAWTPCIGPVLGAILTLAATRTSAVLAAVLLSYYAAGLALPFLLVAFIGEPLLRKMRPPKNLAHILHWLLIAFILIEALALLTGRLGTVMGWLSQFIRIGST